ncbi:MAG: hypothetical protein MUF74_08920 [Cypionkella sp.]|jgi:hypothetical protein|nr:hypothetical protein [Cypionkella sp.]
MSMIDANAGLASASSAAQSAGMPGWWLLPAIVLGALSWVGLIAAVI